MSCRLPTLSISLVLALAACSVEARVSWHDWDDRGLQAAIDTAASERKLLMMVVTQPDWCPPCIRLNDRFLENPKAKSIADLTRDMLVLEIHGHDPTGHGLLKRQGVRFTGTPTTMVFKPRRKRQTLARAELLGTIVGAPDDFAERLAKIASGHDPVAELETAIRAEKQTIPKAKLQVELADLLAARGDADGAERQLKAVIKPSRSKGLGPLAKQELMTLRHQAEWKLPTLVESRVRRDYQAALDGIDAYVARHGRVRDEAEDIAWARAWSLGKLGRFDEALAELETHLLSEDDGRSYSMVSYFCFRMADPDLLQVGERLTKQALERFPDREASLLGGLGRIYRRQGRLSESIASFEAAIGATDDADEQSIYRGQLVHVRKELAAAANG
ncbi:MAG: tetratricopeptide repeat protein [Acidobacteriota bacterium]